MVEHELIEEFAVISEARSFSLGLLAVTAALCSVFSISLNQFLQLPWYSALFLAYLFQFALVIWATDRFLSQHIIMEFTHRYTKNRLAEIIRKRRLDETRADLYDHYNRDRRFGFLLDFLDFLLSPSNMFLFKFLKYMVLIGSGIVLLPYSFVAKAPERYLVVLSETNNNGVTGYKSDLFSLLFIGFVMFAISAIAWLFLWWLYREGFFD